MKHPLASTDYLYSYLGKFFRYLQERGYIVEGRKHRFPGEDKENGNRT